MGGFKGSLYIILFILSIGIVVAENLTCQYTETVKVDEKTISMLYVDGVLKQDFLTIQNFKQNTNWIGQFVSHTFEVHNSLDIPVNTTIQFIAGGSTTTQDFEIPAHSFITAGGISGKGIDVNSIEFIYHTNDYSVAKWVTTDIEEKNCTHCPSDSNIICKNPGDSCNSGTECGGGYCVRGQCSDSMKCFNNDCHCTSGEFQNQDNTGCVQLNHIPSGEKPPSQDKRECMSNYIEQKSGECKYRSGDNCLKDYECETNSCVMEKCSMNGTCYGGICPCKTDEKQCSDNTKCVKKDSVMIGAKPICDIEECKSETYKNITRKYLDTSGLCAVHPDIIKEQNGDELGKVRKWIIGLVLSMVFLVIVLIIGYVYVFKEKAKIRDKERNMDLRVKELELKVYGEKKETLKLELEATIKKIDELKLTTQRMKDKQNIIKELDSKICELEKKDVQTRKDLADKDNLIQNKEKELGEINKLLSGKIELVTNAESNLNKYQKDIDEIKKEYIRTKSIKHKTNEELSALKELQIDLEDNQSKLEKIKKGYDNTKEEIIKPRKSLYLGYGVYEWSNPSLDFYPCYVNNGIKTSKLIHSEQAEEHIYKPNKEFFEKIYPGKKFKDLKVHHINRDFNDYRLENLAIIMQKEEHDLIDHHNIHDRASGIAELKRLGIKQPHIEELK